MNVIGRHEGVRVVLIFDDAFGLNISWRTADDLADQVRRLAEHAQRIDRAAQGVLVDATAPSRDESFSMGPKIAGRTDGAKVFLTFEARWFLDITAESALSFYRILRACARRAEEIDKAEAIIFDHAILLRSGAPFGLSDDATMQDEAGKEAAWNTSLRRYMPGGIKSQAMVGVPAIILHPVAKGDPCPKH